MEGIRLRLLGLIEWLAAAACVLAVLMAAASVSREFPHVRPVVPVNAAPAKAAIAPANLRPGAIAVQELVLPDGKRLATGESVSTLAMLGALAQSGPTAAERDANGRLREARTFRYAGMEFVVVIADNEIVAIYR